MIRLRPLLLALLALALLSPAAAQADDESFREVVTERGQPFARDAQAVAQLAQSFGDAATDAEVNRLERALNRLQRSTRTYRSAIQREEPSSSRVRRGKRLLLSGLGLYARALNQLDRALQSYENDERARADREGRAALRIFRRAASRLTRAMRLIGI